MVKKTARIAIIAFALATVGRIVAVNCFCADGGELRATEARKETLEREEFEKIAGEKAKDTKHKATRD